MGANVMSDITTILVAAVICCSRVSSLDIRMPPSIVTAPVKSKIFRSDEPLTLECVASGYPKPEYEWIKNNAPLSIPGVYGNFRRISDAVGTIHIDPLTTFDEGVYQCAAFNQYGRTLSPPAILQHAVLSPYSANAQVIETSAAIGQPIKIHCQPTKCFPKPTYSWVVSESVSQTQQNIILDRRIQMDEYGHLHFGHVLSSDDHSGKLYKCNLFNSNSDLTMGGSYTKLNVQSGDLLPSGPTLMFATNSPAIALEGHNISIRCFFSGYPEPNIMWSAQKGILQLGRSQQLNYNTELSIRNVVKSDERTYICRAGSVEHAIEVKVQAFPVFPSNKDRPHNVNVTDGDNVTVVCNAYADPPATITWFFDGVKLDYENLPPRVRITQGNTHLTMLNACRDCRDGTSDIRVIQCNASNPHGAVFGDGYVNVLKKTAMEVVPHDIVVAPADSFACFNCTGSSDDSTPTSVRWDRFLNEESGFLPVIEIPGEVILWQNGSLSFRLHENSSSWSTHGGRYKCSVSNGYSVQTTEVLLLVDADTVPPVTTTQAGFPWWIFLILLSIILIILLIVCCCCYLQRNRGETYPVDEKERKNGHNPEKELADSGFQDYIRPEHLMAGSRASLASTRKTISDDELSLNEYGDIDAGKFTEDGSFIGDYGERADV